MKPVLLTTKLPAMMSPTRGMSFNDHDGASTNYVFNRREQLLVLKIEPGMFFNDANYNDTVIVTFVRENGRVHRSGWCIKDNALVDAELIQCP